jgi:hypothetical protein
MIRVVEATPEAVAAAVKHLFGAVDPDGSYCGSARHKEFLPRGRES